MILILFYIMALLLVAETRLETGFFQWAFIGFFVSIFFYYFIKFIVDARLRISTTQYLLIFFVVYMFFNSFIAAGNDILLTDWVSQSRKYLILLLIFPFDKFLNQPLRFKTAISTYILAAFFISTYVLLWWVFFKGDSATAGISSTMPIWAFIILISIIAGHSDSKFGVLGKPLLYFLAGCFLLYLFAESRRTGVIIVITGVVVTFYIAGKAQGKMACLVGRQRKNKKILALILFVPIIYGLISTNARFSSDERMEKSIYSRVAIWYSFIPLFTDNPVLGVGYGYKKTESIIYEDIEVNEDTSPHSLYVDILAYSGIMGLSIFLLFYLSVLRDAYRAIYSSKSISEIWLFSGFVGTLISLLVFFVTSSRGARPEVFTLIALIASISNNQILNYKFNKIEDK